MWLASVLIISQRPRAEDPPPAFMAALFLSWWLRYCQYSIRQVFLPLDVTLYSLPFTLLLQKKRTCTCNNSVYNSVFPSHAIETVMETETLLSGPSLGPAKTGRRAPWEDWVASTLQPAIDQDQSWSCFFSGSGFRSVSFSNASGPVGTVNTNDQTKNFA